MDIYEVSRFLELWWKAWKCTLTADSWSDHYWYCSHASSQGFIFYQVGTPDHMARVTQDWLQANCPGFTEKNHSPQNYPDLKLLDYHIWGALLEKYHKLSQSPWRLMSWKTLCRPSGKNYHKNTSTRWWQTSQRNDCLCGCQWWSLQTYAVIRVHFQIRILISAPKAAYLRATHVPEKTTSAF